MDWKCSPLFNLSSTSLHPLCILYASTMHPFFILSSAPLQPLFILSATSHPLCILSSSSPDAERIQRRYREDKQGTEEMKKR
jgi:hypothetical protein